MYIHIHISMCVNRTLSKLIESVPIFILSEILTKSSQELNFLGGIFCVLSISTQSLHFLSNCIRTLNKK